jgi:hypothetical protein
MVQAVQPITDDLRAQGKQGACDAFVQHDGILAEFDAIGFIFVGAFAT